MFDSAHRRQSDRHPYLEAARLALAGAGLDAGQLVVLAAVAERATFGAGQVVVKVDSDTRRLQHEVVMMAAAGEVGVPVPAVMAFENGPPGVLLMRHMPGEALKPAHGPQTVREVGRLLRRLHSLPAKCEVAWDVHVCTWAELKAHQVVERRLLSVESAARIRARLDDVRATLADRPLALIHDDLQPDHVLVDRGRVSAFLDFADAGGGDPLIDLAVLTLWEPSFEEFLWQGYRPASDVMAAGRVLLPVYRMLRHLGAAIWLMEHGMDGQPDINRIHQLLSATA